jgi:hypothetical protein
VSIYGIGLGTLPVSWHCSTVVDVIEVHIMVGMIQELIDAFSSEEGTRKK